jgi:hypothetical protein
MVITWPAKERSFPMSMQVKPVTQTADVEVKRASTKVRWPLLAEKGIQSRKAPIRITPAKPRMKILAGVSALDKKGFMRKGFFMGKDP